MSNQTVDDVRNAIVETFNSVFCADNVNHPAHYETGRFECFDVMIETQGKEAVLNFCICNAFKYIYRFRNKGGDEDIKKANWYLSKYLELRDSE